VDAIRKTNKECPSCRVKIASHRELRPEPRIDFLLGTVFGDLDKFEEEQAQHLEQLTGQLNMVPLRQSVQEGLKRQQANARKRPPKRALPPATAPPPKRKNYVSSHSCSRDKVLCNEYHVNLLLDICEIRKTSK
jgi:E3 ubiquitin-protein ligase RNF1/2